MASVGQDVSVSGQTAVATELEDPLYIPIAVARTGKVIGHFDFAELDAFIPPARYEEFLNRLTEVAKRCFLDGTRDADPLLPRADANRRRKFLDDVGLIRRVTDAQTGETFTQEIVVDYVPIRLQEKAVAYYELQAQIEELRQQQPPDMRAIQEFEDLSKQLETDALTVSKLFAGSVAAGADLKLCRDVVIMPDEADPEGRLQVAVSWTTTQKKNELCIASSAIRASFAKAAQDFANTLSSEFGLTCFSGKVVDEPLEGVFVEGDVEYPADIQELIDQNKATGDFVGIGDLGDFHFGSR